MGTKLITSDRSETLKQFESTIADCEVTIEVAEIAKSEEWFAIALEFTQIQKTFKAAKKKGEKPFGMKSFNEYMRSDRCDYDRSTVYRLIEGAVVRRVLPNLPKVSPLGDTNGKLIAYTERNIRPLTKLRTDQARIAVVNAAIEKAKTGKVSFGKAIADGAEKKFNTYKHQQEVAKAAAEKMKTTQPARNMKRLLLYTQQHQVTLGAQNVSFWKAVEAEEPGIAVRTAQALEELAAFLRSPKVTRKGQR